MRTSVLFMGILSFVTGLICKIADDPNFIHYYVAGVICLCTEAILENLTTARSGQ